MEIVGRPAGALALGWTAGLAYGGCHWRRLQRRLARRDRRAETSDDSASLMPSSLPVLHFPACVLTRLTVQHMGSLAESIV
jgi:hypothetical protein